MPDRQNRKGLAGAIERALQRQREQLARPALPRRLPLSSEFTVVDLLGLSPVPPVVGAPTRRIFMKLFK